MLPDALLFPLLTFRALCPLIVSVKLTYFTWLEAKEVEGVSFLDLLSFYILLTYRPSKLFPSHCFGKIWLLQVGGTERGWQCSFPCLTSLLYPADSSLLPPLFPAPAQRNEPRPACLDCTPRFSFSFDVLRLCLSYKLPSFSYTSASFIFLLILPHISRYHYTVQKTYSYHS